MMSFNMRGAILAAAASALALSGCASGSGSGIYNGLGDDPMGRIVLYSSSGWPTIDQYHLGQAAAVMCGAQIDPQLSSTSEAMLSGALTYGPVYALSGALQGLYPGATGATAAAGAGVGAATGIGGGAVYGAVVRSQASVTTTGACTHSLLEDWARGLPAPADVTARFGNVAQLASGLHATGSIVRTNNRSGEVPNWIGRPVGQ